MNKKRANSSAPERQMEHICGHLLNRRPVGVNKDVLAIVKLSK